MSHHGNTPAAWTAVAVALSGFVVGGVGLMLDPVSWVVFWVGVGLVVLAPVILVVMDRMGLHESAAEGKAETDARASGSR